MPVKQISGCGFMTAHGMVSLVSLPNAITKLAGISFLWTRFSGFGCTAQGFQNEIKKGGHGI